MRKRRRIRHRLVERFMEKSSASSEPGPEVVYDQPNRQQLKRFLKVVEARKQQILDRMLGD
jgi:hypothetical protein